MPAQRRPNLGARFCIPDPNRKVLVSPIVLPHPPTTNYLCAARRETHRKDGVVVAAQRSLYCYGCSVQNMNFSVETPSCNHVACGRIRNTLHTRVDAQRRLASARRRLPNSDALVPAATSNLFPIWTEANTRNGPVKGSIVSTHHKFENKQE